MKTILLLAVVSFARTLSAQEPPAPALPGRGLAQHAFLYAGEAKERKVFIIREGKVAWTYEDREGRGEISDAVLLSNGSVLLAHQYGVKLVGRDQRVLWNYDAPPGTEIHTAMPIGADHVLYVQNGDPAMVKAVNIHTSETKLEFQLPVKNPKSTHGQFRHARITPEGELLVAHMDLGKVCAYDATGKELRSFAAPGVWGANPLPGGHMLVTGRSGVSEVTQDGKTVWSWSSADAPEYPIRSFQLAWRLPDGHTVVNNWWNSWSSSDVAARDKEIQALEVTADKKVVWVLQSWKEPDLGPATTLQFLDTPEAPENVTFGAIK